jgi:chaperonin cofactor prefoldin
LLNRDESTTPPFDDENNPVLLAEKIKKLSKKLKNERKAKEDLEKRYTHLNDALQSMLTSLNKAHGKSPH